MTTRQLQEKYPHAFQKMGGIVHNLNQVEIFVILALSTLFINTSDPQSEIGFIFNDALSDEKVFPNFENKRRFLIRAIKGIGRVAKENGIPFDEGKWLDVCDSVKKLQDLRNELAHHYLLFSENGNAKYGVRKSNGELLEDKKSGKKGSIKYIEINLEDEFRKSEEVVEKSKQLMAFGVDALNILSQVKNNRGWSSS